MTYFSTALENLIEELSHLPGVGQKSATRLAFHIINLESDHIDSLSKAISEAKDIKHCSICNSLSDDDICPICSDSKRDHKTIMVVENERDMFGIERTGKFKGVYHILMGAISPMLGIGPDQLKIKELMERLKGEINEVIIATNSSIEGETTQSYLIKLIKPLNIKITRLASGMPVGADLENIDEMTLTRAFDGRVET